MKSGKVLLLFPSLYSLSNTFSSGLKKLGFEVTQYDFKNDIINWEKKINIQMFRLPFQARKRWNRYFMAKINKIQIQKFNKENPDIVIVYNNEMLLPETVKYFSKSANVVFFLGDNPFYTPTNDYFLHLLFQANLVISPDSFWTQQLKLMGLKNCTTEYFNTQHVILNNDENKNIEPHDLLFVGMSYVNSWGYKRALFLSQFADMDIRIHGNSAWYRWLDFFPDLKEKFILKGRYSHKYMALLHKNAKIYPFDINPGVLNGIHIRLFDCIEYGMLPLPEYRKDIKDIFEKEHLPIIYDYRKAGDIARYYLSNERERKELVNSLKIFVRKNYNPEVSLSRILNKIGKI